MLNATIGWFPMRTATWNTRRIHVISVNVVDVENSTWNIRWFYVEKWPSGRQILFNVESTSIFILGMVRLIIYVESTSILRRKVPVRIWYILDVKSTSILRRKVSVQDMVYVSTSIQRWDFPFKKDCLFINVEYTSISRWCYHHCIRRFFDVEYTSIQRRNFPNLKALAICQF